MFLAIDIGNTQSTFGLFKKEEPFEMIFRFPTASIIAGENITSELLPKLSALGDLDFVIIASVVPEASEALQKILETSHKEAKITLLKNSDVPIVNKYGDPEKVGIDRLLAALAAYERFSKAEKKPLIVVDLGKATTIDCVNINGEFLGGIITLGISSSAKHLSSIAAQLPEIELQFPDHVLGKSTQESMQSGILFGALSMIEGLISRLQEENFPGQEIIVVVTGGLSSLFEGRSKMIDHIAPHLVPEGIAIVARTSRLLPLTD